MQDCFLNWLTTCFFMQQYAVQRDLLFHLQLLHSFRSDKLICSGSCCWVFRAIRVFTPGDNFAMNYL